MGLSLQTTLQPTSHTSLRRRCRRCACRFDCDHRSSCRRLLLICSCLLQTLFIFEVAFRPIACVGSINDSQTALLRLDIVIPPKTSHCNKQTDRSRSRMTNASKFVFRIFMKRLKTRPLRRASPPNPRSNSRLPAHGYSLANESGSAKRKNMQHVTYLEIDLAAHDETRVWRQQYLRFVREEAVSENDGELRCHGTRQHRGRNLCAMT